jgi:hypothetical protein
MGSCCSKRDRKNAQEKRNKPTETTKPHKPDPIAAMNAIRRLGTLSKFPAEVREQIWLYALDFMYPLSPLSDQHLLRINSTLSKEVISTIRRHASEFRVVDVRRPTDLTTRILKHPHVAENNV